MDEETLEIHTGTMPKTSVSTAARKVCQWSDFILHSVLLCQKWEKERKKEKEKRGSRWRDPAKYHILSNSLSWNKT